MDNLSFVEEDKKIESNGNNREEMIKNKEIHEKEPEEKIKKSCREKMEKQGINSENNNLAKDSSTKNPTIKETEKRLKAEKKRLKKLKEEEKMEKVWKNYTKSEKIKYIILTIVKIIIFIGLLYLFLISLNFMTIGFTLVTPYALKAKNVFQFFLKNPFASLAIGIFLTALLQNSTATTSIAVTMVGAGIISVKDSVPIIMGSNIGTCVTNSFISLSMADNQLEFKRAFSAATLNDFFNYLTTLVLLTVEIIFGLMTIVSEKLTSLMPDDPDALKSANFISAILDPLVNIFIKLDEDQVNAVNMGSNTTQIALRCCQRPIYTNKIKDNDLMDNLIALLSQYNISFYETNEVIFLKNVTNLTQYQDVFVKNQTAYQNVSGCKECSYWCMPMLRAFGDGGTGLFWIILSLVVLLACLFGIVKILSLIIVGPIAHAVRRAINATFPGKFKWLMQLILFLIAFLMTLIVQSSNIITATLVPLCGFGIVSLQRVYVMTLGSNIGTTVTGILSAFTQPASALKKSLQLAFVYTLFNTIGVVFWLPIPFMRFPKKFARKFGNIAVKYKWFVYIYVSAAYFVIPFFVFVIALIPYWIGIAIAGIPILIVIFAYLIILILRKFIPQILPEKLKNFKWLPICMRSMAYWDTKIKKINCCKTKKRPVRIPRISINNDQVINIDEEIQEQEETHSHAFSNFIRRFSAIDSVVQEARIYARRNTIISNPESSGDEDVTTTYYNNSRRNTQINQTDDDTDKRSHFRKRKSSTFKSNEDHETKTYHNDRRNTNFKINEENESNTNYLNVDSYQIGPIFHNSTKENEETRPSESI